MGPSLWLMALTVGGSAQFAHAQTADVCGVKGPDSNPLPANKTFRRKKGAHKAPKIVNGQDATECEYPWQASLRSFAGGAGAFCGGALISSKFVLTAAHCGPTTAHVVVLGDHNRYGASANKVTMSIVRTLRHPQYDPSTLDYDYALIELESEVDFTECIAPVCLPKQGEDVLVGANCVITGWGTLISGGVTPSTLQEGSVKALANSDCGSYPSGDITSRMLCAQGRNSDNEIVDACQGDSGGPLVCPHSSGWTIYGLTSWGFGCAQLIYPGVYSRVHEQLSWIEENMVPPTPAPTQEGCISIVVEIMMDEYPEDISWTLSDSCAGDVVAQGGNYGNAYAMETITMCVPPGRYRFTINDSHGDGLCCSYDFGYFTITYDGSEIYNSNNMFTGSTFSLTMGALDWGFLEGCEGFGISPQSMGTVTGLCHALYAHKKCAEQTTAASCGNAVYVYDNEDLLLCSWKNSDGACFPKAVLTAKTESLYDKAKDVVPEETAGQIEKVLSCFATEDERRLEGASSEDADSVDHAHTASIASVLGLFLLRLNP